MLCGGDSFDDFCSRNGGIYLRCRVCGHVQEQHIANIFANQNQDALSATHHISEVKRDWDFSDMKRQLVFMPRLKNIQAYCSTGRLLDIGCSNGAFIEAATACGWEACGIELRKSSASFARERGLDVFMQPLNELHFQDNSFDAITMWQVLEHLPDPPECMNECCRILKPGGIFAFSTPNVQSIGWRVLKSDWPAIDPGCHNHLFKPATVTMMLEK
jgi:2-polyprenyl-3-methyl-5-hydroxy-6-metoxy-1,4-benzoquinol methylase